MRENRQEYSFDQALDRLDCGTKQVRDEKLYLAQESNTLLGATPFIIEKGSTIIKGPDNTTFDLRSIKYDGEDGLYAYLRRMSETEGVETWKSKGQA